jgi:hypothetical protein
MSRYTGKPAALLRELAGSGAQRLHRMDALERRQVLDLLDVVVTIMSWDGCPACGGRGKINGGPAACRV